MKIVVWLVGWAVGGPWPAEASLGDPARYPAHGQSRLDTTSLQHSSCQAHREVSSLIIQEKMSFFQLFLGFSFLNLFFSSVLCYKCLDLLESTNCL